VIHVIPPRPDDPRECFIYLDDVTFVAEKSLFSSAGPVRFVSRSAMLDGRGMELIYDGIRGRLELFRIVDLAGLRIRSADIGLFSGKQEAASPSRPAGAGESATPLGPASTRDANPSQPSVGPGDYYQCVLRRNVTIDTPERLVVAREVISINNIFWPRSEEPQVTTSAAGQAAEPNETEALAIPAPDALNTTPSHQFEFDALPAESFDIVVTCDGGCVIAPVDSPVRREDPNDDAQDTAAIPERRALTADRGETGREVPQSAIGQRIDYDAATGDAVLGGPVEVTLRLDPNHLAGGLTGTSSQSALRLNPPQSGSAGKPVPMTITATDAVRFSSAMNRVLFQGDCVASAERTDPNVASSFLLSAPVFLLDLARDANAPVPGRTMTIERFSTDGGPASIFVGRRAAPVSADPSSAASLLGWTRVLASRFGYEAVPPLFTARGPGELQLYNGQAASAGRTPQAGPPERPSPDAAVAGAAFDQPCYALLRDFSLLTFAPDTSRIVVSANPGPILFDYIPVLDGSAPAGFVQAGASDQHIWGDAGHLDLTLRRNSVGQMELAAAVASGGITYEDRTRRFAGDKLTYDRDRSLVRITGDPVRPCYLNGALVDQIEMNVDTGTLKTQLRAPSTFQGRR
jgi:hypothetical protein